MSKREYPDHPICGVGAVVVKDGKVLLVKRGVDPNKGVWAIPGGSLKLGETLQEGAEREILEETGITIMAKEPVYSFDFFERDYEGRVRFHYVIVDMIADYISGEVQAADDASEARWVSQKELKDLRVSMNTLKILDALKVFSD
ncbi:MAG TPA: NUDIX hydrolase [Syntrophales bacterium]|nr:NUDIX hydrolase [Syntrophales bacterium]